MKQPNMSVTLVAGVYQTWQAIAPDCGDCDNATAVELVLDADRMKDYAPGAYKEMMAEVKAHGYSAVHKRLCKVVNLV